MPTIPARSRVWAGVRSPETVPVLAPGERTPAQTRDRAGMVGMVLVLALVYGCAGGVLLAWLGGAI